MNEQVKEYVDKYPREIVDMYLELRKIIFKSVSSEPEESLWAKLPSYCIGESFVRLIPFKDHINVEAQAVSQHKEELSDYKITPKGMLQIYLKQDIPYEVLKQIFTESLVGNKMKLILQPTPETCGQACIAMITGKTIEEVIKDMKTSGSTSIGQLIDILDFYGVKHAERNTRISKKNPVPYEYSILTVHTNAGYTHWTLLYDGKYFDPEFGLVEGEYAYGKVTSFLAIYE